MSRSNPSFRFDRTVLALALCAACVPLQAQTKAEASKAEENGAEESKAADSKAVQGTFSVGFGALGGSRADRALFGQYNGLQGERNAVALLGVDYSVRNEESLTWLDLQGSNLLGDTRELSYVRKVPGDWKYSAFYGELVRYDPNSINTGLRGAGSSTPQVVLLPGGPGSGSEFELKTKRTSLGVGFTKSISSALQLELDLRTENKEGSRLFGIGVNCPSAVTPGCLGTTAANAGWALLMLPEPIKSNHSQLEARLSYAVEKFRVSLGYYGSFYRSSNPTLNPAVPASLNNPVGSVLPLNTGVQGFLNQPVALPPDNQAHQLDLSGSYDFLPNTRATFKLAYASATQNDDFASAGLAGAPAGVANLGGKVVTTLAKLGLNSRPVPKLTLQADLRYEDRDDQTPIALYNTVGQSPPDVLPAFRYTNQALPNRKAGARLQANWQFTSDYRGTLGADYESIDRGVFTSSSAVYGLTALRQKTQETGVRAELRRRMSEDFSGAISVSSSKRDGSNWLKPSAGLGVTEIANPLDPANGLVPNGIFMPTLADRQRDKLKLFADWQPSEKFALQFGVEGGRDRYTTPSSYGLRDSQLNQVSVDWTYALSDNWNLSGYLSRGVQTLNQSRPDGYIMAFDNTSIGAGLGVSGKVSGTIEVGANLSHMDDKSVYAQTLESTASPDSIALLAGTGGLPDIAFRQTGLKLYGKYTLDKRSSVRVDLVHQQSRLNDWAWGYNGVQFAYSDGTTVQQKQSQSVSFLGLSYNYQFR